MSPAAQMFSALVRSVASTRTGQIGVRLTF